MAATLSPEMSHDDKVAHFTGGLSSRLPGSRRSRAPSGFAPMVAPSRSSAPSSAVFPMRRMPSTWCSPSRSRSFLLVAALAGDWPPAPAVATYAFVFVAMGSWFQRALTLNHEAAHRLLFSDKRWNDWIGEKLIGWPFLAMAATGIGSPTRNITATSSARRNPTFSSTPAIRSRRRRCAKARARHRRYLGTKPQAGVQRLVQDGSPDSGHAVPERPAVRVHGLRPARSAPLLPLLLVASLGYLLPSLQPVAGACRARRHDPPSDRRLTTHDIRQGFLSKHVFLSQGIGFHLAHHVDSGIPMNNLHKLHRALVEDGYVVPGMTQRGTGRSSAPLLADVADLSARSVIASTLLGTVPPRLPGRLLVALRASSGSRPARLEPPLSRMVDGGTAPS